MPTKFNKAWGWYEILIEGDCYLVKRLCVNSGALMSLQRHFNRSEHWIVVKGEATVYNDVGLVKILKPNESIFIDKQQWHSLANNSLEPLEIIEVWFGSLLSEGDIERLTKSCMMGEMEYDFYSKLVGRGFRKI